MSRLSIKGKLVFIVLTIAVSGILAVSVAHFIFSIKRIKATLIEQTKNEAMLIGRFCVLPLEFGYASKAEDVLKELIVLPEIVSATVYDSTGNYFAGYNDFKSEQLAVQNEYAIFDGDLLKLQHEIHYLGRKYGNLEIVVDSNMSSYIKQYVIISFTIALVVALFSYLFASIFQRQVSNPILQLARISKSISDTKDYSKRLMLSRTDEIGQLVHQFNLMLDIIQEHGKERDAAFKALSESEYKFRAIFDQTFQLMGIIDSDGILIDCNATALSFIGVDEEQVIGRSFVDSPWWMHSPDLQQKVRNAIERGRKGDFSRFEATHYDKNGVIHYIDFSVKPFINENGQVVYMIPEGRDITALKMAENKLKELNETLEERVAERTAELKRANKELEAFSYSVSHDLRAPLRGIDGFAHALKEDYGDVLDDVAEDYINRIRKGAQKLGFIIDEMLRLSKVSLAEIKAEEVNMSELTKTCFNEITKGQSKKIEFFVEPDLMSFCDKSMMRIALDNLLSNAVKYSEKKEHPEIIFGQKELDGEKVFYIRDNGAGFDNKYEKKLFVAFQRLHSTEEFSGTGVGLSIVKRVVLRHNGRIWAESSLGQGATFYFTLALK